MKRLAWSLAFPSLALLCWASSALAAEIAGSVTSASTGLPLADASVYAYDLRLAYLRARTDAAGRFALQGLHEGPHRLRVLPYGNVDEVQAFWPYEARFCEGELLDAREGSPIEANFSLEGGSSVRGRLWSDRLGAWVGGAQVLATGIDSETEYNERVVTTTEDGSFEIRGLHVPESGTGTYTLAVSAPEHPVQYLGGVYSETAAGLVSLAPSSVHDVGDWSLLPGIRVEGRVLGSADGAPVSLATVNVYARSQVLTTASDEDGFWAVVGLPPSDSILPWASRSGLATSYWPDHDRPVDYLDEQEEGALLSGLELLLPPQATLGGRLVGTSGQDFSEVTLVLYNDTFTVGRGVRADTDGSFRFESLHGGAYALQVYASDEGYRDDFVLDAEGGTRWFSVKGESSNDLGELALPLGAQLSGRVVDDRGAPVYGAYAWLEEIESGANEVSVSGVDGEWSTAGLAPGRYTLRVYYAFFCPGDPGWVDIYWPDALEAPYAASFEVLEGGALDGLDVVLPIDDDHDRMGDLWEEGWGLDTSRDDSGEDPDGDGFTNLEEYRLGTNPLEAWEEPGGICGCEDKKGEDTAFFVVLPLLAALRRRKLSTGAPPRSRTP